MMAAQGTTEQTDGRVRVLVVDDSELFRTGLQALLSTEAFEVASAGGGDAALRQVAAFHPDVVVMDMDMPGMSGTETTRRIRELAPQTFVMMLTGSQDDVLEAVRAGASGYLLKSADVADIVKAIHATAAGQSPFAPQVAGALVATVRDAALIDGRGVGVALSPREREVLALLASGANNVEIARRLYISASTVKTHISCLLTKLHVDNRVQAACVATRAGLVDSVA
jgi:two-component system, NarL family, response regulator LiaR